MASDPVYLRPNDGDQLPDVGGIGAEYWIRTIMHYLPDSTRQEAEWLFEMHTGNQKSVSTLDSMFEELKRMRRP